MKRHNRNKKGTMTIFLAIILSALILVECTFVMFVWDLDYRMAFDSALRAEVETILAEYDRQLFDTYGIYAVTLDDVDDEVFQKAISTHGYTGDSNIEIYGVKALEIDDLKAAISVYYANRTGGILFEQTFVQIEGLLEEAGLGDLLDTLNQFTSSKAAGYLEDLLTGASTIAGWYIDAAKTDEDIASSDYRQEMIDFSNYQKSIKSADNDLDDLNIGIELTDFGTIIDAADDLIDIQYAVTDSVMNVTFHPACAYYAANNFDCYLSNDTDCSINGTKFSDIHDDNLYDAEYILNGIDGRLGVVQVSSLAFAVLFSVKLVENFADPELEATLSGVSAAISALVLAISAGTVLIDPEILTTVMIIIKSAADSVGGLVDVLKGESFALLEVEGMELIYVGYKDFLFLQMCLVPDDKMLERMIEVLERDFGVLYTGVGASGAYRGQTYSQEKIYQLYKQGG
ncbi:MAG: hypothetical protein IK123_00635 [Lachnospiraceae bacterium]|nr:hypothetical protein [Lachnospiraceae bacterium]